MTGQLKDEFAKLVKRFKATDFNRLNESQTRLSFIDEFWRILGWDVGNTQQVQVEVTDKLFKRPDYTFSNGKKKYFFVEAKKPSEDLRNPKHIYQTKLYCWNAGVPLAILTDFEEFRPFRSIGKPVFNDSNKGIIKKFDLTFESYPDMAIELFNTFGREAVINGSLNVLLKPTQIELRDTVDKDFLNTLSKWRRELTEQIVKNNKFENEFQLAEAVQRILDRLVFMRILLDREIENYNFIREISKNYVSETYSAFVKVCKELAPKYNGLIFNSHPLSEDLKIESGLFKKIVKEFDINESPYRFDVINVEVLGTIYERFLGDEISFDKKGKVVIDQKPEVRKAGGVYYTPQYIVEYIVQNTVGKLLEDCKSLEDVAKLKILDPACGSGSFLLGAFDTLIHWHEWYFNANPEKMYESSGKNNLKLAYIDSSGNVKLTARMKSKILQNNIYGVDVDKQATEVAQMSLYIKVLEGMANEGEYILISKETILPKMDNNIKCGNSLISSDFINDDFFGLSVRERQKINPFDWESEFPEIFKVKKEKFDKEYFETQLKKGLENAKNAVDYAENAYKYTANAYSYAQKFDLISEPKMEYKIKGGFDAIIGNPPYVQPIILDKNSQKYLFNEYTANTDLYSMFIEKMLKILKSGHNLGFIIPSLFIKGIKYESLRNIINCNSSEFLLKEYGDGVFHEVKMPTCIVLMNKGNFSTKRNHFYNNNLIYFSKIETIPLKNIAKIRRGLEIGRDKIIVDGEIQLLNGTCIDIYSIRQLLSISESTYLEFSKDISIFQSPKIIVRETGNRFFATLETENILTNRSLYNVRISDNYYAADFVLAIINSSLFRFYFKQFILPNTNIFPKIRIAQLNEIPIPKAATINNQANLTLLVERMLKLNKDKLSANESDRKFIEQYIAKTDKEIDRIVYQLYDLNDDEIKIIEQN